MTANQWTYALATLFMALGLWLVLARRSTRGLKSRAALAFGVLLAAASLGLLGSRVPWLGSAGSQGLFLTIAAITVGSALATIGVKNPVYSAIWFAMSLAGTAGLFLYQGAQFLAVATVVVYAGAILVTFLFVLMLANPEGHAHYDRLSWEALLSASAGAAMIGTLTFTFASALAASPPPAAGRGEKVLAAEHMARLGQYLFSEHLIAVEVAGTLLLIALVGAVVIAAPRKA